MGTGTSQFYDANCNPIIETINGNLVTSPTGPGNMTATLFDGTSSVSILNSTGLAFTGDMSISLWFSPSENDTYSSSGTGWQQLIGKGQTTSPGSDASAENDNYQLFQLGNQLLFEWNGPDGTHYQAITTTPTVMANSWNYVTATVNNGVLTIYDNGVAQNLVYDTGNVPNPSSTQTSPPSGAVSITNNNAYPVNIGEQNSASGSGDAFYYNGYIGAVALYNQALTPEQIAANYAAYLA